VGPSPKHWDTSCMQPKEVRSAGICRQPEGGKELLPGFPWGPDSKIKCFEGNSSTIPGQHRDLCMALEEVARGLSPLTRTPALPLEGQWVESAAALLGKEDPGTGSDTPVTRGSLVGLAGTPSASRLGAAAGLGAVTPRVPPLSPRQQTRPADI